MTPDPRVTVCGRLVCVDAEQARVVAEYLPEHIRLTRDEPGCLSFSVTPAEAPLTWDVAETFVDAAAFDAHQARVAGSAWGRATRGITRRYAITGA